MRRVSVAVNEANVLSFRGSGPLPASARSTLNPHRASTKSLFARSERINGRSAKAISIGPDSTDQPLGGNPWYAGGKEIAMKLLFKTVLASGAAMAAVATLPVIGGVAAMCCLLGNRAGARRALDERYARGEINREQYMQRRKDLGEEGYSA